MGAIIGSLSGLALLLITYLGTRHNTGTTTIQEVRMEGMVRSLDKNGTPGMLFPGLGMEPLRRSDYSIVGPASGKGCAHYVGLWPIPFFWTDQEGGSMHFFSADPEGVAQQAAWYDAIRSLPSADAMLSPRTETNEYQTFSLWYRRDCVLLHGKGIEIKLDNQESNHVRKTMVPQNPNTGGGTYNPAQVGGSGGGGVTPALGKSEAAPTASAPAGK